MVQILQDGALRTLVCVTAQKTCERLIRAGSEAARGAEMCVVHVAPMGSQLLDGTDDAQTLAFLYKIVRSYDAELTVEHNDRPLAAIVTHARRINAQCVVVGSSGTPGEPFASKLRELLPEVDVIVVR